MSSPLRAPWRLRPALLALVAVALAACGSSGKKEQKLHVPSPDWEDQVVYFVMTDRFANGDPTNDDQKRGELDPKDPAKYSGGDLQGIIDHLDYIQGLGATAVWITPPVANMWWDPLQQSGGYHGYWARHLEKVDEHLGTLDTYKALSDALHRRGMYLIQDIVPNHMGNFFQYSSYDPADVAIGFVKNTQAVPTSKPEQAPFDQCDATDPVQRAAAIYHWTPAIADYTSQDQEWNWQISDLDDLNTENPVVRKALKSSYGYWIREVGVDAFRVDTAKFVPHEFWNDFFHSADPDGPGVLAVARATGRDRFLAFGEVYETPGPLDDAADRKVASYLGTAAKPELPAVLGFPLYAEIERVFAGGSPTSYMTYRLGKLTDPALFPTPNLNPNFIDNHDVRRFLSVATPAGMAQALAFLFTVPGIPVVYYGTEQLFTETRAAMFEGGWHGVPGNFETAVPNYNRLKKLADLRRSSKVFTRGAIEVLYDNPAAPGGLAYRRTLGAESALVLMNTSDENVLVTGLDTKLPAGAVLEVLHSERSPPNPVVGPGGKLTMALPPRAVIVARPTGQVTAPPAPGATLTLATPVEGQTFTKDVTLTGTVSPVTRLRLVVDDALDRAVEVPVAADGTWSAVLPVSNFPEGKQAHTFTLYAPTADVANRYTFTSDVVFEGLTTVVPDPVGDDTGPAGTYTYPKDGTFRHQMDIESVTVQVGATTMNLRIKMADWSTVWNPPAGFDHVAFNIYFSLPGQAGATSVMPKLQSSTPAGFTWSYDQASYGWGTAMYTSVGATADAYGTSAAAAVPRVSTDGPNRTVIFGYDRTKLGLATWSGVQVYIATWDFDGIGARFRPLTPDGGQWEMGGGATTDPMIMDDVPPITLTAP